MSRIIKVISLNEEKPNTCDSCKHTDNDLGLVALHCQLLYDIILESKDEEYDDSDKVRSWNTCTFNPSRYEPRSSGETADKVEK